MFKSLNQQLSTESSSGSQEVLATSGDIFGGHNSDTTIRE